MTKDEKKDELKNRISMALKDPILQQGFEIICREFADLEQRLEQTEKDLADYQFNYPTIKELEKENAELKERLAETNLNGNIVLRELTKAKEIIREYMRFEPIIGTCSFYSEEYEKTKTKAEQFLKEIE